MSGLFFSEGWSNTGEEHKGGPQKRDHRAFLLEQRNQANAERAITKEAAPTPSPAYPNAKII